MAWSKQGQRAQKFASIASGFSIAAPAGATAGALALGIANISGAAVNSSNFTQIKAGAKGTNNFWVGYKTFTAALPFEITYTGTKSVQGFYICWTPGAGFTWALDGTGSIRESSGSKSLLTTGITVAANGSLLVNTSVEGSATAMVQPTGFTEITDEGTEETHGIHTGWKEQASGETGEQNFKEAAANVEGLGVLAAFKAIAEEVAAAQPGMLIAG